MPVELRKRPAPAAPAPAPAAKRSASKPRATGKAKSVVEKVVAAVTGESSTDTAPTPAAPESKTAGATSKTTEPITANTTRADPVAGTVEEPVTSAPTSAAAPAPTEPTPTTSETASVPLNATSPTKTLPASTLSTQIQLQTADTTTLNTLLSSSTTGIIIFTYPKASTPGCTTQACLFRDAYDDLRAKGYTVYGLSGDSPKANTTFKTKQSLQYEMLCDVEGGLIRELGMRKPGGGKGTTRGVVVLGKEGVVVAWKQAGPAATLEAVKDVLGL